MNKKTMVLLGLFTIVNIAKMDFFYPVIINDQPTITIQNLYHDDLDLFSKALENLTDKSSLFVQNNISEKDLQSAISNARLTFKKIEYLIEYIDPELISKSINGAPLPKLMPKVPEISIIEPCGLQTLDEIIYLNPTEEKEQIFQLAKKLEEVFKQAIGYQKVTKIHHRIVFEGARFGIIRMFTLGLTGFDTPGSANAIPEAIVNLESIKFGLSQYERLSDKKDKTAALFDKLMFKISDALSYLHQNQDFDTFDRMLFFKLYVSDLYKLIPELQSALNIESTVDVNDVVTAYNYSDKEFFDEGFFNAAYFTNIATSDLYDSKKVALGKLLFYDPVLSKDLNMTCASCHDPKTGFSDGLPLSKTNELKVTTERNSPTLLNSAFYGRYFWDMREYNLERQVKHVMVNEHEFNIDFIDLTDRLKESSEYQQLFDDAYGYRDKYGISTWSISNALAAYVTSLSSFNSPFDQYMKGQADYISEDVKKGFNLFMGKAACGTCHFAPAFNGTVPPTYRDSESEILGITTTFDTINPTLDNDPGRIANGRTEEEAPFHHRSFKTASVRNVTLTAPYMHNGGFKTLEEVVHFYNKGGGAGLGLEVPYQTLPDSPLGLNNNEVTQIVAFMEALTDTIGLTSTPNKLPNFEQKPEWNNRLNY